MKKVVVPILSVMILLCLILLVVHVLFSDLFKPLSERLLVESEYEVVHNFTFDNIRDFIKINQDFAKEKTNQSIVLIIPNDTNYRYIVNVMPSLAYSFVLIHYILFLILLIMLICFNKFLIKIRKISYLIPFCLFSLLTIAVQAYTLFVLNQYEYVYTISFIVWFLYIIMMIAYYIFLMFDWRIVKNK